MPAFSPSAIKTYRTGTYFKKPGQRLASADEAVEFVDQRGFAFFWPIKDVEAPSLWVAAAGDRPVADEHDDPGHVTWTWKDSLLGQRRWYYGRVLKRRNAMLSLAVLPYFYVLSPNFGDPENDYLEQYLQGTVTAESKTLYECLLTEGPLDTIALRKAAHLSNGRFAKALDDLQMAFKVLPVGISQAGAWRYSFIYDLTHRQFPDLISQAGAIYESTARQHLTLLYLRSVGAIPVSQVARLFGWKPQETEQCLKALTSSNQLVTATVPDQPHPWLGLPELIEPSSQ